MRQTRACKRSRRRPSPRRGRTTCAAAGATRCRSESDLPNADSVAGAMETDAHSQAAVVRWCRRSPRLCNMRSPNCSQTATIKQSRVRSCGEGHEHPVGGQPHKSYTHRHFPGAKQLQIRQIRPGQTGMEFARLKHHQIKDVLYACLVAIGIRKDAGAAFRHLLPPCSPNAKCTPSSTVAAALQTADDGMNGPRRLCKIGNYRYKSDRRWHCQHRRADEQQPGLMISYAGQRRTAVAPTVGGARCCDCMGHRPDHSAELIGLHGGRRGAVGEQLELLADAVLGLSRANRAARRECAHRRRWGRLERGDGEARIGAHTYRDIARTSDRTAAPDA